MCAADEDQPGATVSNHNIHSEQTLSHRLVTACPLHLHQGHFTTVPLLQPPPQCLCLPLFLPRVCPSISPSSSNLSLHSFIFSSISLFIHSFINLSLHHSLSFLSISLSLYLLVFFPMNPFILRQTGGGGR